MKTEYLITFVIVVLGVIAAMWLSTKVLKLNNYDEYEALEQD